MNHCIAWPQYVSKAPHFSVTKDQPAGRQATADVLHTIANCRITLCRCACVCVQVLHALKTSHQWHDSDGVIESSKGCIRVLVCAQVAVSLPQ